MSEKLSPEAYEGILNALFMRYATDRTKGTATNLKMLKFKQMLADAGVASHLELKKLELIFLVESKHRASLDFESFLNCLPRVAAELWPDSIRPDLTKGLDTLVTHYLFPLYEQTQKQVEEQAQMSFDEGIHALMTSFLPTFEEIYLAYFHWELSSSPQLSMIKQRSHATLQEVLRDLDVCPLLINKSTQFSIWRDLMENSTSQSPVFTSVMSQDSDLGKVFKLSHLIEVLYKCAQIAYKDDPTGPSEKFSMLVERLELSPGFANLKKRSIAVFKTHKPVRIQATGIPSLGASEHILSASLRSMRTLPLNQSSISQSDPAFLQVAEKWLPLLQSVFQYYCSVGDPTNITKLQSAKFVRFLKDAGLVKDSKVPVDFDQRKGLNSPLSIVEADILFSKLTGGSGIKLQRTFSHYSGGALDLQHFLKALELIALKVYPETNSPECFKLMLDMCCPQFERSEPHQQAELLYASKLLDLLQISEVADCLECLEKSLGYFYSKYADPHGLMDFPHFLHFAHDFGVFPEVCSKGKLVQVFSSLAKAAVQAGEGRLSLSRSPSFSQAESGPSEMTLNPRLCMEAFVVLATEIEYAAPQPSPCEKICLLVERMNQSEGPVKALKEFGQHRVTSEVQDLLQPLKDRFPGYFNRQTPAKTTNFRTLISTLSEKVI